MVARVGYLLGGAWLPGGMHGCGGMCVGYDKIWSMSGWYASYWNAFLLIHPFTVKVKNYFLNGEHKPFLWCH